MYECRLVGGPADGEVVMFRHQPCEFISVGVPSIPPKPPSDIQTVPEKAGVKSYVYQLHKINGYRLTYKYREQ